MKLSKIVDAVNAKSFGETNWTYDDIYPYFQEAISEINGEIELFRNIAAAPDISESDSGYANAEYTMLSDTHILNYIVTYIVVAMDNAQLAVTSRTQTYASQLAKYKQQLISDLYKWMPLTHKSNNFFDLEYSPNDYKLPNPGKVWYDESFGKLSSRKNILTGEHMKVPTTGVKAENPYGYLVPAKPDEEIKEGLHRYKYIFIPFDDFRSYYRPVEVFIEMRGYDVDFDVHIDQVDDIGYIRIDDTEITSREQLFAYVWDYMSDGKHHAVIGSYKDGNNVYTYVFTRAGSNIFAHYNSLMYTLTSATEATLTDIMTEAEGYEHYAPKRLELLSNVNASTPNNRVTLFANDNGTAAQISVDELRDRIVRTSENGVPSNAQVNQYILIKKD